MSVTTRITKRLTRPMSRPLALFLLWSHRRTIAFWARSFRTEFERGRLAGHDPHRWRTLVQALWRVSRESSVLQENELRRLIITADDEVVATVAADSLGNDIVDRPAFVRAGTEHVVEPVVG
jgi:hypothetical protein